MAQEKIYETVVSNGKLRYVFYAYNDLGSAEAKIHALKCLDAALIWDHARFSVIRHRAVANETSDGATCIAPDVARDDFVEIAGEYTFLEEV